MIGSFVGVVIGSIFVSMILGFLIFMAPAFIPKMGKKWDPVFDFSQKHSMKVGTALFLLALTLNLTVFIPYVYSDGIKKGNLTKITKKGFIFKTFEGQINMGGMTSDSNGNMTANVFNFSILDPEVFKQLQSKEGAVVSLKYSQFLRVPLTKGDTNYIITELK